MSLSFNTRNNLRTPQILPTDVTLSAQLDRSDRGCDQGARRGKVAYTSTAPISSRSSPSEPGLFSRFFHRAKSKKEEKGIVLQGSPCVPVLESEAVPKPKSGGNKRNSAPATPTQKPKRQEQQLPAPNMGTTFIQHPQQQPPRNLKKRKSIRDRFRALAKDPQTSVSEQQETRVIYVPTHAARDFSYLPVSPRTSPSPRPQLLRHSYEEPRTILQQRTEPLDTITADPDEDESESQPYSPPNLQILMENEPVETVTRSPGVSALPEQHRLAHQTAPQLPESSSRTRNSRHRRHHSNPTADPLSSSRGRTMPASSSAGAHVHYPTTTSTTNTTTTATATTTTTTSATTSSSSENHSVSNAPPAIPAPLEEETRQPTDYELFLARAEKQDLAYREKLLRTLSQRQYPPRPEPEVATYQPRNSASYTADLSTGSTAVGPDQSGHFRKTWEGRISGLDSGIGSKSSSQDRSRRESDEQTTANATTRASGTWERGHRKRASWAPSFGVGGTDAERRLERVVPEVDEGYGGGAYTTSGAGILGGGYVAQQPRTLKRQTSIKQKLGEYIKPTRQYTSRYEEPEYVPGMTRMEFKRSKSKRIQGH